MGSTWNAVGIVAWILVIVWLIFIINDIRRRHLKMIVVEKKKFSLVGSILDGLEILVLLVAFLAMIYTSTFRHVEDDNNKQIQISYDYEPLVMQTNGDLGYYVVKYPGKESGTENYVFWVKNAKYKVDSRESVIIDSSNRLNTQVANHVWKKGKLKKADKENQGAFVATMHTKYKNTFLNGLGMHAGKNKESFRMIKVPDSNFINTKK